MPAKEVTEALIAEVDALKPSPSQRAHSIWLLLTQEYGDEINTWDLVCFCAEYLGSMVAVYPWLEEDAKALARKVYTAHYIADHVHTESVLNDTGVQSRTEPESDGPRTLFESMPPNRSST